jgi:hypothetical protein
MKRLLWLFPLLFFPYHRASSNLLERRLLQRV